MFPVWLWFIAYFQAPFLLTLFFKLCEVLWKFVGWKVRVTFLVCVVLVTQVFSFRTLLEYFVFGVDPVVNVRPNTFSISTVLFAAFCFMVFVPLAAAYITRVDKPTVLTRTETVTQYTMERMVNGSAFISVVPPKFIGRVYIQTEEDGVWMLAGTGFNTNHGFLTAYHVVAEAVAIRVATSISSVDLAPENFRHVERLGDLAVYDAGIAFLKRAKLTTTPLNADSSEMVMIHNGELASVGPLKGMDSFGMVSYQGSTTGGFSGAPYYMGNLVYGMHLGASSVNLGYEAAYLDLIMKKEESEDYYLDKIRKGDFVQWRRSPGDPDEVEIKTRTGYYTMDRAAFDRALAESQKTTMIGRNVDKFGDNIFDLAGVYDSDEGERKTRRSGQTKPNRYAYATGVGGKAAGGRKIYQPHSTASLTAPRVDFNDSENFEWPAVNLSPAGPSFVEKPIPTKESSAPILETACPSQKPGCPTSTAAPDTTVTQKETALPSTSASTPQASKIGGAKRKLAVALRELAVLQQRISLLEPLVLSESTSSPGK